MLTWMLAAIAVLLVAAIAIGLSLRYRRQKPAGTFVDLAEVRQMGWDEYSVLVSDYFLHEGYVVKEQPTGGVDFDLQKGDRRWMVQCEHWRSQKVDEPVVRSLFQMMAARNATGGFILTCGTFTPAAVKFASGKRIDLIDGKRLVALIEEVQGDDIELTAPRQGVSSDESTAPRRVILCPRCGRGMVRRTDRTTGREFYGCPRYPSCRGRREIA